MAKDPPHDPVPPRREDLENLDEAETLPKGSEKPPAGSGRAGSKEALGPYPILEEIGRGGMGKVLRVEDPVIGREVALKVALAGGEDAQGLLYRFQNEARITGQLDHPNIPAVHALGVSEDNHHYFTMKLVRGNTLGEILEGLRTRDPSFASWSLPRLLETFLKVCDAVAFAHAKGVVHRDLKPENVMIGRFGEVYVMDWGLAKVVGTLDEKEISKLRVEKPAGKDPLLSTDGQVIGTPTYMSPEAADGQIDRIDAQSDV
ncbi:MAG: serine/threonine-protein kinase, partial [Planctomycetota bacterium]